MRTRVKICGITRIEDATAAARAGADAIGLVFEPKSPRYVKPDQAQAIMRALPPFVTVVGLFVNAAPDTVETVLNRVSARSVTISRQRNARTVPPLSPALHQSHSHATRRQSA